MCGFPGALDDYFRTRPPEPQKPDRPAAPRHDTVAGRGIYVASRASLPGRAEMWRRLRSEGWPIVSTWIDEDGPGQTDDLGDLWTRIAREVAGAAGFVLYVEPDDFPLKGALVEAGMAIAAGVPVIVVSPSVEIDPRSCRPIGSWMRHPLVNRSGSVTEAFRRLLNPSASSAATEMWAMFLELRAEQDRLRAILQAAGHIPSSQT